MSVSWKKNNRDRWLEIVRDSGKRRRIYWKKLAFESLGNRCSSPTCAVIGGMTDVRCLQIDHVKGGGREQRKKFCNKLTWYKFVYEQVKIGSKDYQLLCANCNWIKRVEKKEDGS